MTSAFSIVSSWRPCSSICNHISRHRVSAWSIWPAHQDALRKNPSISPVKVSWLATSVKFEIHCRAPRASRTTLVAFAASLELPPPVVLSEAQVNAQTIHAAPRSVHHKMEWLADNPTETLLQLGLELSAPQGVLGPACFLPNPIPGSGDNSSGLPVAPPLRDDGTTETDEEERQASCLAIPFVLRSEDDFRMAHIQQTQRLAQEREVVLQLRYVRDLMETDMLERLKVMSQEKPHRMYRRKSDLLGGPDLSAAPEDLFVRGRPRANTTAKFSGLHNSERQLISTIFALPSEDKGTSNMHCFECGPRVQDPESVDKLDSVRADKWTRDEPHLAHLAEDRCHDCRLLHFCSCRTDVPPFY
eukprot:jgi/Botrbrau1/7881/Bobra.9_2s0055.1